MGLLCTWCGIETAEEFCSEDCREDFAAACRLLAAPLYEQAYREHQFVTSPTLALVLNSKAGRKALREAADIVETERASGTATYLGKVDEELTAAARAAADVGKMEAVGQPGVIRGFSLETWDQIKRGFDILPRRRSD